jgi:hypothetical protein
MDYVGAPASPLPPPEVGARLEGRDSAMLLPVRLANWKLGRLLLGVATGGMALRPKSYGVTLEQAHVRRLGTWGRLSQ